VATGPYVAGLIGDRVSLTAGLSWSLVPAAVGVALVGMVGLRCHSEGPVVGRAPRNPPS
jgi:hypothetical protein